MKEQYFKAQQDYLFDQIEKKELRFQTVKQSKYENLNSSFCEIFSQVSMSSNVQNNLQSTTEKVYLGFLQGVIILFQKLPSQNSFLLKQTEDHIDSKECKNNDFQTEQYLATHFLKVNFAYMDVKRQINQQDQIKNNNKISPQPSAFILARRKYQYIFSDLDNDEIKIWINLLNLYVIRLDKPFNYEEVKMLGRGSMGDVKLIQKIIDNQDLQEIEKPLKQKYLNLKRKSGDEFLFQPKYLQIQNNIQKPKYYALKVINKASLQRKESNAQMIRQEIKVHRALKACEQALQLRRVYESSRKLYLLLDYQEGGTLIDLLNRNQLLREDDLRTIFAQILLGIDFMHKERIVHRDIKLENILMTSKDYGNFEIRIADFGLSKKLKNDEICYHKCGTPSYIAPEILKGYGYTTTADLFSLGSLLFSLITGKFLFSSHDQNLNNILRLNRKCDTSHVPVVLKNVSHECLDLVMVMLESDPQSRITCKNALKHPWFKKEKQALLEALQINKDIHLHKLEMKSNIQTIMINTRSISPIDRDFSASYMVSSQVSKNTLLNQNIFGNERSFSNLNDQKFSSILKIKKPPVLHRSNANNTFNLKSKNNLLNINQFEQLQKNKKIGSNNSPDRHSISNNQIANQSQLPNQCDYIKSKFSNKALPDQSSISFFGKNSQQSQTPLHIEDSIISQQKEQQRQRDQFINQQLFTQKCKNNISNKSVNYYQLLQNNKRSKSQFSNQQPSEVSCFVNQHNVKQSSKQQDKFSDYNQQSQTKNENLGILQGKNYQIEQQQNQNLSHLFANLKDFRDKSSNKSSKKLKNNNSQDKNDCQTAQIVLFNQKLKNEKSKQAQYLDYSSSSSDDSQRCINKGVQHQTPLFFNLLQQSKSHQELVQAQLNIEEIPKEFTKSNLVQNKQNEKIVQEATSKTNQLPNHTNKDYQASSYSIQKLQNQFNLNKVEQLNSQQEFYNITELKCRESGNMNLDDKNCKQNMYLFQDAYNGFALQNIDIQEDKSPNIKNQTNIPQQIDKKMNFMQLNNQPQKGGRIFV